jgi:hypothetical protein
MTVLNVPDARALVAEKLGDMHRAAHSLFVGDLMALIAEALNEDEANWQVTGYCHDLDYFEVDGDWTQHGLVTQKWLSGRLSADALAAIAAHDHRTGVQSETRLARALRLADALAVLDERIGRSHMSGLAATNATALVARLQPSHVHLGEMIDRLSLQCDLELAALADIVARLPEQVVRG